MIIVTWRCQHGAGVALGGGSGADSVSCALIRDKFSDAVLRRAAFKSAEFCDQTPYRRLAARGVSRHWHDGQFEDFLRRRFEIAFQEPVLDIQGVTGMASSVLETTCSFQYHGVRLGRMMFANSTASAGCCVDMSFEARSKRYVYFPSKFSHFEAQPDSC